MELALLHHPVRGKPHGRLAPRSHPDSEMTHRDSQPVEIVGGGLAGLALSLALQRRDVPATVVRDLRHRSTGGLQQRICCIRVCSIRAGSGG